MFVLPHSLPPTEWLTPPPLALPPSLPSSKSVLCLHSLSQSCYFGWKGSGLAWWGCVFFWIYSIWRSGEGDWWELFSGFKSGMMERGIKALCRCREQVVIAIRAVRPVGFPEMSTFQSLWNLFLISDKTSIGLENQVVTEEEISLITAPKKWPSVVLTWLYQLCWCVPVVDPYQMSFLAVINIKTEPGLAI